MTVSRLWAGLAAALLLAACSPRALPPAPGPEAPRPAPSVLAQPATGALDRVAFQAGDVVGARGIYFQNAATGAGEGWLSRGSGPYFGSEVSGDNRFVIAGDGENGYLVDRQNSAVWRWDPQQLELLLADVHGFLFAEVRPAAEGGRTIETGRFFWAAPDFKLRGSITL